MYLTRKHLTAIILLLAILVVVLALPGCGVIRDLPKYW